MNDRLGNTLLFLSRFFMLAGVFLLSQAVFSFIGMALCTRLYGLSYVEVVGLISKPQLTPEGVYTQRWVQSFYNIGSFLVTAVVFTGFYRKPILRTLGIAQKPASRFIPAVILLLIPALFVISGLSEFNSSLPGMEQLGNLKQLQESRDAMLNVLLHTFGTADVFVLVFTLAFIPAICEEVFFRGLLLPFFADWTGNKHLGVWLSGLLFTILHFSVTQFIPILFMGMVLGYIYLWTRSIWAPVLLHFLNNLSTVVFHRLSEVYPQAEMLQEHYRAPLPLIAAAAVMMILIMVWIRMKKVESPQEEALWP
ncbi:MAG: CPBP family intramembrane metalloprotease [Bacteroidetes bacterium]|nr:CPBP family intramembrane metalloprotease [Bacteroidota bacterium]